MGSRNQPPRPSGRYRLWLSLAPGVLEIQGFQPARGIHVRAELSTGRGEIALRVHIRQGGVGTTGTIRVKPGDERLYQTLVGWEARQIVALRGVVDNIIEAGGLALHGGLFGRAWGGTTMIRARFPSPPTVPKGDRVRAGCGPPKDTRVSGGAHDNLKVSLPHRDYPL